MKNRMCNGFEINFSKVNVASKQARKSMIVNELTVLTAIEWHHNMYSSKNDS